MIRPTLPSILTGLMLLCAGNASALQVSINGGSATCGNNTGYAMAWVSGGTAPYTYQWSNGATTDTITGLAPGNYSVTVTDANSDQDSAALIIGNFANPVLNYSWSTWGIQGCHGQCNGGVWYDEQGMPLNLVPPFSFSTPPTYGLDPNDLLRGAWTGFCPGFTGTFTTVTDALGCVAELQLWPYDLPDSDPTPMSLVSASPSCAGMNGGAMVVNLGVDNGPVGPNWQSRLLDDAMQPVPGVWIPATPFPYGPNNIATITGRPPGTYYVERRFPNYYSGDCVDLLQVTIPDLGPDCGIVWGTAYVDVDQNCFMAGNEARVPNGIVEVLPGPYYATLGADGKYLFNLPSGSYTLTQTSADVEEHCTGAPIPFTITDGNYTPINLPDTSVVPLDLEVMVSSGAARPGFQFQCAATVRNLTPTSSGNITLTMTFDPVLTFVNATPSGTVLGNTITWNQPQLTAWQERDFIVNFSIPPDPLLIGTPLTTSAAVTSVGSDAVPANNTAIDIRTITGSYDPNDKLATTNTGDTSHWMIGLDEWIDYTIRFQNTGTDTAFNVLITDTLPMNLDPLSIQMGAGSHPFGWELRDQSTLKFYFQNILLPDSNFSEPLSHGFVGFRIRPRLPVMSGETIENTANIYFDFNPAVVTEPSILVAEFSTGEQEQAVRRIEVYPDPADDVINVLLGPGGDRSFTLHGADGRMMRAEGHPHALGLQLDVSGLAPGIYVLHTAQGAARFMKR